MSLQIEAAARGQAAQRVSSLEGSGVSGLSDGMRAQIVRDFLQSEGPGIARRLSYSVGGGESYSEVKVAEAGMALSGAATFDVPLSEAAALLPKAGMRALGGAAALTLTPTEAGGGRVEIPLGDNLRAVGAGSELNRSIESRVEGMWLPTGVVGVETPEGLRFDRGDLEGALGGALPEDIAKALQMQESAPEPERPEEPKEPVPAAWAWLDEAGEEAPAPTCAPKGTVGTWEVVSNGHKKNEESQQAALAYQRQITRTPELADNLTIEYRVTNLATGKSASFDGCAYWSEGKELLEAKHGYGQTLERGKRYGFYNDLEKGVIDQVMRQSGATGGHHPVEWHISDPSTYVFFENAIQDGSNNNPLFSLHITPALSEN